MQHRKVFPSSTEQPFMYLMSAAMLHFLHPFPGLNSRPLNDVFRSLTIGVRWCEQGVGSPGGSTLLVKESKGTTVVLVVMSHGDTH